jgi:hypothetical protein
MIATACAFFACDDDFMNRVPQTSITTGGYFKSVGDLTLYVNGLVANNIRQGVWNDYTSDNVTITQGTEPYAGLLYGRITPANAPNYWTIWGNLRAVNLAMDNLDRVEGDEADINHEVGRARYCRARLYIEAVKNFSDVPWYESEIGSNEEDLLYKTQDPRDFVVDKIMEDLEFAAANIKADMGNRTRLHKYVALAELARFALYEGTSRKYRSELGLASTADRFLQRAVTAAEEIMNSGQFEITGAGTNMSVVEGISITGSEGYRALFSSMNLDGNREMIQWADYNYSAPNNNRNFADDLMSSSTNRYSLTRSLQESYLTKDGRPFSTVSGYATKEYGEVFIDRDPRMAETFAYPGVYDENFVNNTTHYHITIPGRGGYDQSKFFIRDRDPVKKTGDNLGQYNDLPIFRYAEILLTYAEAKAELGQLDDASAARSINPLRNRVGMPNLNAANEVDASLRALYPGVSDVNILAVRRERRVELAGEGLRHDDIFRWGAGKLFEATVSMQGIYIPRLPYVYDVTGDGIPDIGIAATASAHSSDNDVQQWYDLDDPDITFYLENGTSGYIRNKEDASRRFEEPKYYYWPIHHSQLVLNPNLKQPYGW